MAAEARLRPAELVLGAAAVHPRRKLVHVVQVGHLLDRARGLASRPASSPRSPGPGGPRAGRGRSPRPAPGSRPPAAARSTPPRRPRRAGRGGAGCGRPDGPGRAGWRTAAALRSPISSRSAGLAYRIRWSSSITSMMSAVLRITARRYRSLSRRPTASTREIRSRASAAWPASTSRASRLAVSMSRRPARTSAPPLGRATASGSSHSGQTSVPVSSGLGPAVPCRPATSCAGAGRSRPPGSACRVSWRSSVAKTMRWTSCGGSSWVDRGADGLVHRRLVGGRDQRRAGLAQDPFAGKCLAVQGHRVGQPGEGQHKW